MKTNQNVGGSLDSGSLDTGSASLDAEGEYSAPTGTNASLYNFAISGQMAAASKGEAYQKLAAHFTALRDGETPESLGEGVVVSITAAE